MPKFKYSRGHGKTGVLLLTVFIGIVLLAVCFSLMIYKTAVDTLKKQIKDNGKQVINNVYQENETVYYHAQSLLQNLMNDKAICEFVYDPQRDALSDRYWWIPIYNSLRYYRLLYPNLRDIYIYYPSTDVVISSSQSTLQNISYMTGKLSGAEGYDGLAFSELSFPFYPAVKIDSFPQDSLTFWGMINRGAFSDRAFIFLELDLPYMMKKYVSGTDGQNGLHLYNNEHLFFTTNQDTAPFLSQLDADTGVWERDNDICVYSGPDSFGFRYALTYSKDYFWQALWEMRLYTAALLLVFLAAASITIFIYTRWNQQQLQGIIALAGNYGVNMEGWENEFKKIRTLLSSLFHMKLEMEEQITRQTADARAGFLQNLLTGNFDPEDYDSDLLENSYSLKLSQPYYIVLLYRADTLQSALFSKDRSDACNRQMLYFAVLNVAEDMLPQEFSINSVVVGSGAVTLLNFSKAEFEMEQLRDCCEGLVQKLQTILRVRIHVSVSQVCTGMGNIQYAYLNASRGMERGIQNGQSVIYVSGLDNEKPFDYSIRYSLITEQQLLNYLKAGQQKDAEDILRQIFQENSHISQPQEYRLLTLDVISTLLKSVSELESLGQQFPGKEDILSLTQRNAEEMPKHILEISARICEQFYIHSQNSHPLYQKVQEYIRENYMDSELNVSKLGEIFGYSTVYLSKIFKMSVGESILDYIAQIRIQKAKEALASSKASAQQVSLQVGYKDYHSFLRVFKKLEGVSPQTFRANANKHSG